MTSSPSPSATSRPVYRREQLRRLFEPRSVAVVGATTRAGAFGEKTLALLKSFDGRVYPVNAKYDEIHGRRCYPSLSDLPEVPDCVVIAVGRELVEAAVEECGRVGVGGVLIYASGYTETGKPERAAQQARLAELSKQYDLRIVGPNCMGIANHALRMVLSFVDFAVCEAGGHAVGVASQSGGMSNSLTQSIEQGSTYSHVLSTGNSVDVDVADLVSYLVDVPECKAIACLFEGLADPGRFIEAAERAWAADKPLIVHKLAVGEQGSAAAVSHTGSLAGSSAAYKAAFARCGVVEAERFEDLVEMAAFFAKAPRQSASHAPGVAVISTSGGVAILAADAAEASGVPLPQPQSATREVLERHIPEFGSARNPCDVTAQVMADLPALEACVDALMVDPGFGAIVMGQPQAYAAAVPRIKMLSDKAIAAGKMACNVMVAQWADGPGAPESERDDRLALFRSMNRCFQTLAAWNLREQRRQRGPRELPRLSSPEARGIAADLIGSTQRPTLTESESKRVLAAYGVGTVTEVLVQTADEAVRVAAGVDGPVVLKVESPDLPHKTEAGVIRLNLRGEAAVREAFNAILANGRAYAPEARIHGVLVQEMVPAGVEIMVGARVDPLFGPLVVVGLGGVFVELLKDSAVALAPVNHREALDLLASLKGQALLDGFRGGAAVDRSALAQAIVRLSELAADHAASVAEMDVNPLICSGSRIIAVDALIVRHP